MSVARCLCILVVTCIKVYQIICMLLELLHVSMSILQDVILLHVCVCILQDSECDGSVGGSKPYTSQNHFARCGYFNVFTFNSGQCTIEEI